MSTAPSSSWELDRTIPSDTSVGSELIVPLMDAMRERSWLDADIFRVQLAYEEAVVNAIRHGNRCDPAKVVAVKMHCDTSQVRIEISDEGPGFDPSQVPDPRDERLLEVPGGRGVLLINEIMSEVRYEDGGRRIVMVKRPGDPLDNPDAADLESD